jgi:hypothetical protein
MVLFVMSAVRHHEQIVVVGGDKTELAYREQEAVHHLKELN